MLSLIYPKYLFILNWCKYMYINMKQGNSVTRDLPPTGSEANTTIFWGNSIKHKMKWERIVFRENTAMPFRVTVRKLNVTDGHAFKDSM